MATPLMPRVQVDKPSRSNVDLSHMTRFTAAPGFLYPVNVLDLSPGDNVHLDMAAMIKTLPLLGPLMGSFKVQFDHYFVPIRLYNKLLHDNRTQFDPSTVYLPQIQLQMYGTSTTPPVGESRGVHPTSLWHFLGIPEFFARQQPAAVNRWFNAVPLLGYWDIFRGYYANTQVPTFPLAVNGINTNTPFTPLNLSLFNDLREEILSAVTTEPYVVNPWLSVDYGPTTVHRSCNGLLLRTFLPDRFSSWVNTASYTALTTASRVVVASNAFTMDDLRFASKLNSMLQKTLVSGGRFSEWQQVQYGVSPRSSNELPRFLSSVSTELVFEDIVQTSASTEADPLGTLGGRGLSYLKNRVLKFYADEHGYLMTIMSICPRVDYYQGTKHYMRHYNMGQLHVPAMDGIGFQDLTTDDYNSYWTTVGSDYRPVYAGVGKQPAWVEYMTAVNDLHGDFANPNGTMYLTLARRFSQLAVSIDTYVYPQDYNYIFAQSDGFAQNYWIQLRFGIYVNRVISKRIMPHL